MNCSFTFCLLATSNFTRRYWVVKHYKNSKTPSSVFLIPAMLIKAFVIFFAWTFLTTYFINHVNRFKSLTSIELHTIHGSYDQNGIRYVNKSQSYQIFIKYTYLKWNPLKMIWFLFKFEVNCKFQIRILYNTNMSRDGHFVCFSLGACSIKYMTCWNGWSVWNEKHTLYLIWFLNVA